LDPYTVGDYPAAVAAITQLSSATRKSLDQIAVEDVERWDERRAKRVSAVTICCSAAFKALLSAKL
jgi:hypothetical protein